MEMVKDHNVVGLNNKPNILIVADFPNWAYHHIGNFISEALKDDYNFYLDFVCFNRRDEFIQKEPGITPQVKKHVRELLQRLKYRNVRTDAKYDIVLFLAYYNDVVGHFNVTSSKIIKGVYTQGFPPRGLPNDFDSLNNIDFNHIELPQFIRIYLKDADAIVCGAPSIRDYYSGHFNPCYFANMALDERAFSPSDKSVRDNSKFVVGWTGTPDRDFKGFHSHIIPAVERAKQKCPGLELKTRFSGSLKTLPHFYCDVDLIVIASEADAGPALFAEASLSGIPSVSTRVGMPQSVIEDGINGYFVERDIDAIAEKIIYLYNNKEILNRMRARIRDDFIKAFGRKVQIEKWKKLFNETLSNL
jgi:glycosyltransferase involved in cell wall biosynthesis